MLMFKKRRQRSKKYTLTSFGSVDEDRCQDSQEEDGVLPGSESEFDEEGFSSVPDPTWDSDYLDMLEKRATAGTEGRGDGAEDAPSPGLSDTVGKGAQLFEQQRKRVAEHAKKAEAAKPQIPPQSQVHEEPQILQMFQSQQEVEPQINLQPQHITLPGTISTQSILSQAPGPVPVASRGMTNGDLSYSAVSTASMEESSPPVAPKPATASVTILTSPGQPAETPLPELPVSNVLNRTARPFTPGFISIRAATAPVTFRPPVTKTTQRPASTAVVPPPFSTTYELDINNTAGTSQLSPGTSSVISPQTSILQSSLVSKPEAPVTYHPPSLSTCVQSTPPITTVQQAPFPIVTPASIPSVPPAPHVPVILVPGPPTSQIPVSADQVITVSPLQTPVAQLPLQSSIAPLSQVSVVSQSETVAPTPVPGPTGRTGILLEARRRNGKPKPMFNVPDVKKKSPNPELLSMVQNLDDRSSRYNYGQPPDENIYDDSEEIRSDEAGIGKVPPPVAPKPRVVHEAPQILQAGGKGAQLFAKRQSRMGMYVVDTPPETTYQKEGTMHSAAQPLGSSLNPSLPSQWKYSPNVRAPPPIGYNPLLAPSIPTGPQRETNKPDNRGRGSSPREGIKALDFMRRQPYQLNSAMFNYGGSAANLAAMPSYQAQQRDYIPPMVGSSLTSPRQIPIKTARVYEVKRFSTPTPMSGPSLAPKVLAPRSATCLGERLTHSGMTSPPPETFTPTPVSALTTAPDSIPTPAAPLSQPTGPPNLPKFSATPIPNPVPPAVPTPYAPVSYTTGLQSAKQFQSAPELSILASLPPLKSNPVQAPKPRFVATKGGVQPRVWRPGAI